MNLKLLHLKVLQKVLLLMGKHRTMLLKLYIVSGFLFANVVSTQAETILSEPFFQGSLIVGKITVSY